MKEKTVDNARLEIPEEARRALIAAALTSSRPEAVSGRISIPLKLDARPSMTTRSPVVPVISRPRPPTQGLILTTMPISSESHVGFVVARRRRHSLDLVRTSFAIMRRNTCRSEATACPVCRPRERPTRSTK